MTSAAEILQATIKNAERELRKPHSYTGHAYVLVEMALVLISSAKDENISSDNFHLLLLRIQEDLRLTREILFTRDCPCHKALRGAVDELTRETERLGGYDDEPDC